MILTLHFGFHEPYSGAWMTGQRELFAKDEKDAQRTEKRYAAYFKETYGSTAEVTGSLMEE